MAPGLGARPHVLRAAAAVPLLPSLPACGLPGHDFAVERVDLYPAPPRSGRGRRAGLHPAPLRPCSRSLRVAHSALVESDGRELRGKFLNVIPQRDDRRPLLRLERLLKVLELLGDTDLARQVIVLLRFLVLVREKFLRMYVRECVCVRVSLCVSFCVYTCVCAYLCMCLFVSVCLGCVCVSVCVLCLCVFVCVFVCLYIHEYVPVVAWPTFVVNIPPSGP